MLAALISVVTLASYVLHPHMSYEINLMCPPVYGYIDTTECTAVFFVDE